MRLWPLLAALIASPAIAQVSYPPASIDTSNLATKTDVQAASTAAGSAQTTATNAATAAAAAQAAIPPICTSVMPQDTYTGSVGTQAQCTPRKDATRPTQVQATTAVTASDGSFTGAWPAAFGSTPQYAHAEIYAMATPYVCQINTVTATTYTGKCFQVISTTLPGTLLALGGLVVSPISSVAAGLTVKVIARQ